MNKLSTERLITCPGSHSSRMVESGVECRMSDLECVHVTTTLLLPCDARRLPWQGELRAQKMREGQRGDRKDGELKASPTLILLYNFISGQPRA